MMIGGNSAARQVKELEERRKLEESVNLKIIKPGDAVNFPKIGDSISIHYIGYLEDGTMFDNSYGRKAPICFILGSGQVVQGIDNVMPILSRGEKARITLKHEVGFGEKGFPPIIPPYATVIYEIELVSFTSLGHKERFQRPK